MAAAAVDTAFLANFTSIPEPDLQTLIETPNSETITAFLTVVIVKAQEHECLKSEHLRLEVELENAVRGGESRARALKTNTEQALRDIEDLRKKILEEESKTSDLEARLQNAQSNSSANTAEVESLRSQIARLEKSNRDTLSLLDAKSTSQDKLAEDLASEHQKILELRRQISTIDEQRQTAEAAAGAAKIRESNIQSQADSFKRNNDWLDSELKTKTAEFTKYKKDKTAKISELQRLNDELTANLESSRRIEVSLRKRLEEVSQKADDAFQRTQQLQEEMARSEESSRLEAGNIRRLADLQQQSAETARRRVGELEILVEQTKDDAAEELAQIQAELETERETKEAAEAKVEQLELRVEQLESAPQHLLAPGTPRSHLNGISTPQRGGSPAVNTPGSIRSRGGLSMTQMYTEYNNLKAELETEKRRNAKLSETIDDMIRDLEQKEPEIQELHMEHNRLQGEVNQLSELLAEAGQEKESARKDARRWQGKVDGLIREAELSRQQLRDLSVQIKVLLVEVQLSRQGEELSATERVQLQQAAQGDNEAMEGLTDTARFISERLIVFKNVFELQERNMELTRLTREIGERMESDEAREKAQAQLKERAELDELRERVERYQDEMKSLVTQSESFIRERDMFRRMLSHRGKLPPEADHAAMFGASINGAVTPSTPRTGILGPNAEQSPSSRELADYAKLLKELQSHFDAYRKEAATDHSTLKDQIDRLAKEKSQLQGEIARANSQLTLAQERLDMLRANYNMLQNENSEIQKRSNSLAESAAKQDLRTQQVAEELVETKSLAESLRNENANLKAERNFWSQTESRMTEENQNLREESSRLNRIITDTQNLHNEQKLTDSETRRKLQSQVETFEVELRTAKRKLEEEIESSRNTSLRREYEQEQNRTRIDDLMKSLSVAREELATVKTTRDQLQARVEELKIELRNAEERSQALQPKPTPRHESNSAAESTNDVTSSSELEQELRLEIAELKKNLDLTKSALENAQTQIEQYKAISQSAEEELQSLTEVNDQYREDTDKVVAEKDQIIRDLEQRVEDISSELSETNKQISEIRATAEDSNNRLEQQKSLFEDEVIRIKDENERYKETANFYHQDLKAQAEIAQQAQRNYEEELVKHAEAAKALQIVRNEYNGVRLEVSEAKADAEAARTALSQNEESWSSTRDKFEDEVSKLRNRYNDAESQNKLLHTQLETISSQIATLQKDRAQAGESLELTQSLADTSTQNLQEVIKYLRREKEIVDVQYELSVQEAKRLRQQLDYSQTQLDDARLRLEQERQNQSDRERTSASHNKLMETINELNVFRESSVTLRNETRQAQAQLADRSKQVEELVGRIQPLQTSIRELENERETRQGEYKLLEEDRDRWQQRTQTILQKYDRIDPAELEGLKEQIKTLEEVKDATEAQRLSLQQQVDDFEQRLQAAKEEATKPFQESRAKMIDQFKARSKELSAKIRNGESEITEVKRQLEEARTELEQTKTARDEAIAQANAAISAPTTSQDEVMQNNTEEGQIHENVTASIDTAVLEQRALTAEAKCAEAETRINALRAQVEELQAQVNTLEHQLNDANSEVAYLRQQAQDVVSSESNSELTEAKEKLAEAQEELETLRVQVVNSTNGTAIPESVPSQATKNETETETEQVASQVAAQVAEIRAELDAAHEKRVTELEQQYHQRAEQMKRQLSTKLTEGKNNIREQLGEQHAQAIEALRQEHEKAISDLNLNHQKEIDVLKQSLASLATGQPAGGSATPQTPAPSTAPPATENLPTADSTPKVQVQTPQPGAEQTLTPQQVRALIQSNATAREIVGRNIRTKLEQETTKLKEESEKLLAEKLEDAKQRAEKTKEQAVNMESKRWSVKISLAENKARTASAKIEYVQKAATETPQRPVVEVWAEARDIKAQPVAQPPPVSSAPPNSTVTAAPALQSTATPPMQQNQHPHHPQQQQQQQQQQPTKPEAATTPTTYKVADLQQHQTTPQNFISQSPNAQAQSDLLQQSNGSTVVNTANEPSLLQNSNNYPNARVASGTGPAALRGLMGQGSGIPRGGMNPRGNNRGGRGGSNDMNMVNQGQTQTQALNSQGQRGGAGIPRGIGRGARGGRGGLPQVSNAQAQPNAQSLPAEGASRGGAMNAQAKQFVPGNKRPRQDSTGGGPQDNLNVGKRIRGGGAGQ